MNSLLLHEVDAVCVLGPAAHRAELNRLKGTRILSAAIAFCAIMMVVEAIGGVVANSLAVLSDAVHMLTDVFALLISLFAAHASTWGATGLYSFGWRRAEVVGALVSLLSTWALVVWIGLSALERGVGIVRCAADAQRAGCEVLEAPMMFGLGCFGFVMNVVLALILHYGGLHSHGHGFLHVNCHDEHHHDNMADESILLHVHHPYDSGKTAENGVMACSVAKTALRSPSIVSDERSTRMDSAATTSRRQVDCGGGGDAACGSMLCAATCPAPPQGASLRLVTTSTTPQPMCDERTAKAHLTPCGTMHEVSHSCSQVTMCTMVASRGELEADGYAQLYSRSSVIGEDDVLVEAVHDHGHGSMNVRAAMLHVIGDCLQAFGVILAAAVMWTGNRYHHHVSGSAHSYFNLADPLLSLVFGVITIFTTRRLMREVFDILMERVPPNVAYGVVLDAMLTEPHVTHVADLHVWSVGPSFAVLCATVVVTEALAAAEAQSLINALARRCRALGVHHSTIQITYQLDGHVV